MLIESATQLCILLAITKYLDDLQNHTLIKAKESSLTPREQASCPDPDADDSLAEGNLLLKQREEEKTERPPTTKSTASGGLPAPSQNDTKRGQETLKINKKKTAKTA